MTQIRKVLTPAFFALGVLGLAAPASAQMYPGEDVTVNPYAIPAGPGLLQPGQPYPGIRLHRPYRHRIHRHVAKTETPAEATTPSPDLGTPSDLNAPAAQPAPTKPQHRGRSTQTATKAPAPDTTGGPTNPIPFTFGGDTTEVGPVAAPTTKVAKTEAPPVQPHAAATAAPLAGLTKRGAILFEHNSTDPTPSQLDGIKLLAGDLNSAIEAGATHIQLQAFGGAPGDKSSDARRISLKRALAIRQLLIDNGVPANRIDVRAMGGATDKGNPDRVDVYVKAG